MASSNNTNDDSNDKEALLLPLSTADVAQEVRIRLGSSGQAAIPTATVMQHFDERVRLMGDQPALHQKIRANKVDASTPWKTWTWREYRAQVDAFGVALIRIGGCGKFDVVNILGFNAPEWFFANFGAMAAGCVPAGIYATNNAAACHYISAHSQAKVVVVEGAKQLQKYLEIAQDLPFLKAIVVYGEDTLPSNATQCKVPCYVWKDFLKAGTSTSKDDTTNNTTTNTLKERSASWKPGETCTLIYTSGTTGPPKAVMITNDNITWTVRTMLLVTRRGKMDDSDHMISYLPLSHIAAQMLDMHMPLKTGTQIHFAQPDALQGTLGMTLKEVRPTVFFGVPRVWEKIYDKLQEVAKASTGIKKKLSTWAKGKSSAYWESQKFGSKTAGNKPFMLGLANKLLHKAHVTLGFDRCYAFYVSAAPIEVKILRYFVSINVPIMELFGQSECTGPHSVNTYTAFKVGTVGRPLPGTETKMGESDGELCYRGRHIFAGYMGMADKTAETIDPDGWLHSGDVVKIDNDHDPNIPQPSGFICITGRIKELIITAGGENVPPVLIEDELKSAMPALSNAMVTGDMRKFLCVLLCLQVEIDATEGIASNKLTGHALDTSKSIGSSATTTDQARDDPAWQKYFKEGVAAANKKATSKAQQVGKWSLLSTDFTEKGGELTPTLKLKRSVAAERHAAVIEAMYA